MSVSSITRRKLLLLNKERSGDFKQHLSSLTTTEREDLYDFVKSRYILKRNVTIVGALALNVACLMNATIGPCVIITFTSSAYVGIINDAYIKITEMIDEVETRAKKD